VGETATSARKASDSPWLRTITTAGLIAGTCDITAACTHSYFLNSSNGVGGAIIRTCQSVASGLYGRVSFQGGMKTALLGLLLHYGIATVWATVFFVMSRKLALLREHYIAMGAVYGIFVYTFMYWIVIPNSAIGRPPAFGFGLMLTAILIHIFCIGLPISITTHRLADE